MRLLAYGVQSFSAAALLCCSALPSAGSEAPSAADALAADGQKEFDSRLKWNLETLVGEYRAHGRRNPKWDESAEEALTAFAQARTFSDSVRGNGPVARIPAAVKSAITNGCDDPMLRYLQARYVL